MQEIDYKRAFEVGKEASKILKDYPHLEYEEAIEMAKKILGGKEDE